MYSVPAACAVLWRFEGPRVTLRQLRPFAQDAFTLVYRPHVISEEHDERALLCGCGTTERAASKDFRRSIVRHTQLVIKPPKWLGVCLEFFIAGDKLHILCAQASRARRKQHEEFCRPPVFAYPVNLERAGLLKFLAVLFNQG